MSTQVCTFLVDDLLFGVDVTEVQEVIRYQEVTPVPLAPGAVSGLINLRGQIVTALNLRARLGLPEKADDENPMNVVLRRDEGAISLQVDEIGDVLQVDEVDLEPPPMTLDKCPRALIQGVYKLNSQLLLLLNTKLTVNFAAPSARRQHG